jgi:2-polyprenyl-6-methoxyphenol hydroxylase-like FAD-dependent oxidoreductase
MTLALTKKGIPVTLIEQLPDAPEDQRAATVHPPTVEMLVDLGVEAEMFSKESTGGMESPLFHFRDRTSGELIAVFDISLLKGEVPYPYVVQWEQYKLVHAALPHIKATGLGEVRFSTKLTGLTQTGDYAEATVTNADGETEKLRGKYLIGTDGGSSTVRRLAEIAFEGFTWPERFIKIGTNFDFGETIQTSGSTCSRSKAGGRPESGAACSRYRIRKPTRKPLAWQASSAACRASIRRVETTRFRTTGYMQSISALLGPSTRAGSCSPAIARTSIIRSAAWA